MPPYGACLLASLNLSNFVLHPFTQSAVIDFDRLREVTGISIIGLNEVLEEGISLHPLEQQKETARQFRQVGLGVMGLADLFIKLGIEYGSEDSIKVSAQLGECIRDAAIRQSIEIAKVEGPYPAFDAEIIAKSDFFKSLPQDIQDDIKKYGMRNSHVLSIAPTGSISTMWGVSGGIEPIFAKSYTRTTKSLASEGDVDYKVYKEIIRELMDVLNVRDEKKLPAYAITSHEIDPINRVKVQGEWQKYIDSAISSTINLNEDATVEDIEEIYVEGWKHGLKGVTVFRNNSWRTGILTTDKEEEIEEEEDCST